MNSHTRPNRSGIGPVANACGKFAIEHVPPDRLNFFGVLVLDTYSAVVGCSLDRLFGRGHLRGGRHGANLLGCGSNSGNHCVAVVEAVCC